MYKSRGIKKYTFEKKAIHLYVYTYICVCVCDTLLHGAVIDSCKYSDGQLVNIDETLFQAGLLFIFLNPFGERSWLFSVQ